MSTENTERSHYFRPISELPDIHLSVELFKQIHNIIIELSRHPTILLRRNMHHELLRLYAFLLHFPRNSGLDLHAFAAAGFYPTGDGDYVACYCCGFCKRGWTNADDPIEVHRRYSSACSFFEHNQSVNTPFLLNTEGGLRRTSETTAMREVVHNTGPSVIRSGEGVQHAIIGLFDRTHHEENDQIEFLDVLPEPIQLLFQDSMNLTRHLEDLSIVVREIDRTRNQTQYERIPEIDMVSPSSNQISNISSLSSVVSRTIYTRVSGGVEEEDGSIMYPFNNTSDDLDCNWNDSEETELKTATWRVTEADRMMPVDAAVPENVSSEGKVSSGIETSERLYHSDIEVTSEKLLQYPYRLDDDSVRSSSDEANWEESFNENSWEASSRVTGQTTKKEEDSLSTTEMQLEAETAHSYENNFSPVQEAYGNVRKQATDSDGSDIRNGDTFDISEEKSVQDSRITKVDRNAETNVQIKNNDEMIQSAPIIQSANTFECSPDMPSTSSDRVKTSDNCSDDTNLNNIDQERSSNDLDQVISKNAEARIMSNEEMSLSTPGIQSTNTVLFSTDMPSSSADKESKNGNCSDNTNVNIIEKERSADDFGQAISRNVEGHIERNEELSLSTPNIQTKDTTDIPPIATDKVNMSVNCSDLNNVNKVNKERSLDELDQASSIISEGQIERNEEMSLSTPGIQSTNTVVFSTDMPSTSANKVLTNGKCNDNTNVNIIDKERSADDLDQAISRNVEGQIERNEEMSLFTPGIQSTNTVVFSTDMPSTSADKVLTNNKCNDYTNVNIIDKERSADDLDQAISRNVEGQIERNEEMSLSTPGIQSTNTVVFSTDMPSTSADKENTNGKCNDNTNVNIIDKERSADDLGQAISRNVEGQIKRNEELPLSTPNIQTKDTTDIPPIATDKVNMSGNCSNLNDVNKVNKERSSDDLDQASSIISEDKTLNVNLRKTGNLGDDPTGNNYDRPTRRGRRVRTVSESSYFNDHDRAMYAFIRRPQYISHEEEITSDENLQQQASGVRAVPVTNEKSEDDLTSLQMEEKHSKTHDKPIDDFLNSIAAGLSGITVEDKRKDVMDAIQTIITKAQNENA